MNSILLTETQPKGFEQQVRGLEIQMRSRKDPWTPAWKAPRCYGCLRGRTGDGCCCHQHTAALFIQRFYRRRLATGDYLPDYISKALKSEFVCLRHTAMIVRNAHFINTLNLKDGDKKDLMIQLNNLKDLGDRMFTYK
jgi:hypothetical protein